MEFIGIIPARYESSRFPGKPLVDIHGKSMIQRVYEQCLKAKLNRVVVATDDTRIFEHVKDFEGEVVVEARENLSFLLSPPHLEDPLILLKIPG